VDFILLDLGQTGMSLIRRKDDASLSMGVSQLTNLFGRLNRANVGQRGNAYECYSFAHNHKISYFTTVVWVQDYRKPGGFLRVGDVHLARVSLLWKMSRSIAMLHTLRPKSPGFDRGSISGGPLS
jgi:hypothetical protein